MYCWLLGPYYQEIIGYLGPILCLPEPSSLKITYNKTESREQLIKTIQKAAAVIIKARDAIDEKC